MLRSSQQAGGCKKPISPPKARATLKGVRKTIRTIVLLTIAAVTGVTGNHRVSVTVGDSSVLTCPFKGNITLLTWKISPKVGDPCTLSYRADTNMMHNNCSNNINWKFRPGLTAAPEIRQVGIAQEGNYTCEVVTADGNLHMMYHLTVLAPPRLSLYCDKDRSPVCEAAAGKPPAQVSWVPESNSTAEEKWHHNGTVTVLSRFTACSTRVTHMTTCMVSHPAGNWSQSIACYSPVSLESSGHFLHCVISLTSLTGLLFLLAVLQLYTFCYSRRMSNWYKPRQLPSSEVLEQR